MYNSETLSIFFLRIVNLCGEKELRKRVIELRLLNIKEVLYFYFILVVRFNLYIIYWFSRGYLSNRLFDPSLLNKCFYFSASACRISLIFVSIRLERDFI
jgi:hypothetical protein